MNSGTDQACGQPGAVAGPAKAAGVLPGDVMVSVGGANLPAELVAFALPRGEN